MRQVWVIVEGVLHKRQIPMLNLQPVSQTKPTRHVTFDDDLFFVRVLLLFSS